ncbi:DUF3958 family protein [Enterococcus sp. AZ109]|uniref:DUF3958 family protein n=1 Tax=Enterococcus sp. AZ109 TaxID=2774634 RepID=UPI003F298D00
MRQDKLTDIRKQERQLDEMRNTVYKERRDLLRMQEMVENEYRKSQNIFQELRFMLQKNDDRHEFGDLYGEFSRDSSKTMVAFAERSRELKREEQRLAEAQEQLIQEKKKINREEDNKNEH